MNILISCTSFLPNSKTYWKKLSTVTNSIEFEEYNNIILSFKKIHNYDALFCIILLQDIQNINKKKSYSKFFMENLIKALKSNKLIYISISSFFYTNIFRESKVESQEIKFFRRFKQELYLLSKKNNNLYIIDLDLIFSKIGFDNIFDSRNWYFSHLRFSNKGLISIDNILFDLIKKKHQTPIKLLVLDCDNTLWGGIVGEDESSNLKLGDEGEGLAFKEFQSAIKNLNNDGLLLALSSKNIAEDVNKVFMKNMNMVLKKNDIIVSKINWKEKHENIREISEELSIGISSIAFWDDNPLEREKIKKQLPEVFVFDVPEEVNLWAKTIKESNLFVKQQLTKEDLDKNKQYKSRAKFKKLENLIANKSDLLKEIKLVPKIKKIDQSDLVRVEQLCLKTNQFNLSTKRYYMNELSNLFKMENNDIFILSAKDKFGDHGKIGLAILVYKNNICYLDTFILSCRILGRDIESWFLQNLINNINKSKYNKLNIEYKMTARNEMVKDFLVKCNFKNKKIIKQNKQNLIFEVSTNSKIINIKKMYE